MEPFPRRLAGGRDRQTQIEEVNTYLNNVSYLTDPINYGVADYLAVPREHLSRQGDCDDYAIAKFLSLRSLGFSNEGLRVVVLQDLNLRIPHAVLAVYVNDAGRLSSTTRYAVSFRRPTSRTTSRSIP